MSKEKRGGSPPCLRGERDRGPRPLTRLRAVQPRSRVVRLALAPDPGSAEYPHRGLEIAAELAGPTERCG